METGESRYTAFAGPRRIAAGTAGEVVLGAKACLDAGETDRIALYEDATGRAIDVDFRGTPDEVLARLADHPLLARPAAPTGEEKRGPGRPKLGVVSREVSLLPRHWEWLAEQSGGASATLRKLVDRARRENQAADRERRARETVHRFLWDLAGDYPDFEEASRALFAGDDDALVRTIADWPPDVRDYVVVLLGVGSRLGPRQAE